MAEVLDRNMIAGQEDGRGANKVAEVPHTKQQRCNKGAKMLDRRRSILEGDRGAGQERLK